MTRNPEEEESTVEFTFDFTEQKNDPVELLPEAGPEHPPTILDRSEPLMPMRYQGTVD
ncbi:hypothetical protein ACWC5C_38775 [Streptomyces sp. NPDC001700]